jgi:hypothetical protein
MSRAMLPDAALRSIASNLARLSLDPVLHLKIAAAVVGPLMNAPPEKAKNIPAASSPRPARRRLVHEPAMKLALEALDLNHSLATNASALARAAGVDRGTASRAIQARKANGADPRPARSLLAAATRGPDAAAQAYLSSELAKGPVEAATVDAMVEKGRFLAGSIDRAKETLDLVACRANLGRGSRVCLATREQAAELGAVVAERGERLEPATPPGVTLAAKP